MRLKHIYSGKYAENILCLVAALKVYLNIIINDIASTALDGKPLQILILQEPAKNICF